MTRSEPVYSKVIVSLFILCFIYTNAAIIAAPEIYKRTKFKVPVPRILKDNFMLFGIFGTYEKINKDIILWGWKHTGRETGEWIKLPVDEYLPFSLGNQRTRVWAYRHRFSLGRRAQTIALGSLAEKIRNYHNEHYPAQRVSKVIIQSQSWPRSQESYEKHRVTGKIKKHNYYKE